MAENKYLVKGEGVPDFVLLTQITEDAVMENIKVRYAADRIYTYIGSVVVSVNPYKKLDIYNQKKIEEYKGKHMYEMAPHIGESGAGKTEASKVLMQYLAAVSKSSKDVDRVKSQLLESNPVLEAFGNAKTVRNDNSSRFGKYMEVQFKKDGAPVGGRINIYLLEKSRVVVRAVGERSFHIFYQIMAGLTDPQLKQLGLTRDANSFSYLKKSQCSKVDTIDDPADFKHVQSALSTLGFSEQEKSALWSILAGILHLGNVSFAEDSAQKTGQTAVHVVNTQVTDVVAGLWQCEKNKINKALTYRSINTGTSKRASVISVPLDTKQAEFSRDALAKATYERVFIWLVEKINERLACKLTAAETLVVGILDIYGFEIFQNNSFEQFCINLCNEKLQQLFIELTLKSEQEEYIKEGIQWEPVKYFNNKVICDLIEGKPVGIISLLDECCLITESTDLTFLDKMSNNFSKHGHFETYNSTKDRAIPDNHFRIKHYAGDVTYNVDGFLEKNKDTLFIDLILAMETSNIPLIQTIFPLPDLNTKKRPLTSAVQFKNALQQLMEKLLACEPHYIRCIKPNDTKRSGFLDQERVLHQVRYLGLLENIRVRRAGFAFRQTYDRFLWRYKMITKETWPRWKKDAKSGTETILKTFGIKPEDFRTGKTKIFIRNPTTLFMLEEKRDEKMPMVVTRMQAAWRGHQQRSKWVRRKAATTVQLFYRRYRFRKYFKLVHAAFAKVKTDPAWGKTAVWPQPPSVLTEGAKMLKKVHANWRAFKMVTALTPEQQAYVRQKILAYDIFKGRKNKEWDLPRKWEADYLETDANPTKEKYVQAMQKLFSTYGDAEVIFADYGIKINHKLKAQKRGMVVTDKNIYKHDPKTFKLTKVGTPISEIKSISLSPQKDSFVIVHYKPPFRDIIVEFGCTGIEKWSEFVTVVVQEHKKLTGNLLPVNFSTTITANNTRTEKEAGKDFTLTVQHAQDGKVKGSVFKEGKNNQHFIIWA